MIIKMKILSIDEQEQSMVVRFYTDKVTEEMLAIGDGLGNIPRDAQGNVLRCRTDMNVSFPDATTRPRGEEIEAYLIRFCAPISFLSTKEAVADPNVDTTLTDLQPFVGVERTREVDIIDGRPVLRPVA